jgi:hypothetical protein
MSMKSHMLKIVNDTVSGYTNHVIATNESKTDKKYKDKYEKKIKKIKASSKPKARTKKNKYIYIVIL